MEWIDKELGNFWWTDTNAPISIKQKYKLFIDIIDDWNILVGSLQKVYDEKYYTIYTGKIIHDGNRSVSTLRSYIIDYEKGGEILSTEGWYSAQKMLEFIRQGEILIKLFELDFLHKTTIS